jgi:hypothetical protein
VTRTGALTVVGGGDSRRSVRQLGFATTSSGTSQPVAARAWSTSRARAPGLPVWRLTMARTTDSGTDSARRHRIPLMAGNWKMNLDHLQATHLVQKLDWT